MIALARDVLATKVRFLRIGTRSAAIHAGGCATCCGASTVCVVRVCICFCSVCCSPADARAYFCDSLLCRVFCSGPGVARVTAGVAVCSTITLVGESACSVSAASCGSCACPWMHAAYCCAYLLLGGVAVVWLAFAEDP